MGITVACPQCGSRFLAPDEAVGKRTRCRKCGGTITVFPDAAAGERAALPPTLTPPPPMPSSQIPPPAASAPGVMPGPVPVGWSPMGPAGPAPGTPTPYPAGYPGVEAWPPPQAYAYPGPPGAAPMAPGVMVMTPQGPMLVPAAHLDPRYAMPPPPWAAAPAPEDLAMAQLAASAAEALTPAHGAQDQAATDAGQAGPQRPARRKDSTSFIAFVVVLVLGVLILLGVFVSNMGPIEAKSFGHSMNVVSDQNGEALTFRTGYRAERAGHDMSLRAGAVLIVGKAQGLTLGGTPYGLGDVVLVTADPGAPGPRFRLATPQDKVVVEQKFWSMGYDFSVGPLPVPQGGRLPLLSESQLVAAGGTVTAKGAQQNLDAGLPDWRAADLAWLELRIERENLTPADPSAPWDRDFSIAIAAIRNAADEDEDARRFELAKRRRFIELDDRVENGARLVRIYLFRDALSQWPDDGEQVSLELWGARALTNVVNFEFELSLEGSRKGRGQLEGQASGRFRYDRHDFNFSKAGFRLIAERADALTTRQPAKPPQPSEPPEPSAPPEPSEPPTETSPPQPQAPSPPIDKPAPNEEPQAEEAS